MKDAQVCPSCVASMSFGPCGHEWLQFYKSWKNNDSEQFSTAAQAVSQCLDKYAKYYPNFQQKEDAAAALSS